MKLPDIRLETHFSKWEFKAEHHLTASDAEAIERAAIGPPSTIDEPIEAIGQESRP